MLTRRTLLAAPIATSLATPSYAATADSFAGFLAGVRKDAMRAGISANTLQLAFAGVQPNQKVLERDRHQPEFTLSWAQYRALVAGEQRIVNGRAAWRQNNALIGRVQDRYGVGPVPLLGIWGLESGYGETTGNFNVIEALATLAWEGRRATFFRPELMAALKILDHGDVAPGRMTGSYAGAMGQPQFMPTSYLRYAVDFDGDGRRDIWTSKGDTLASIANYLAGSGWRPGETWGQRVTVPGTVDPSLAGRDNRRTVADWQRLGVQPAGGPLLAAPTASAALLLPDGAAGEAFLVYSNFTAIRRYNPSDFYALAVGLIGDMCLT